MQDNMSNLDPQSCPCASTEHHATKTYWGSGCIPPRILDLCIRWRWVVIFTPRPIYTQGKSPWYPLDRSLDGPQSQSGHGGKEKNSQPLPALEPPIIQPVAQRYTTELSRLLTWTTEMGISSRQDLRMLHEPWGPESIHGSYFAMYGLLVLK
jgi:hypothetical protein